MVERSGEEQGPPIGQVTSWGRGRMRAANGRSNAVRRCWGVHPDWLSRHRMVWPSRNPAALWRYRL